MKTNKFFFAASIICAVVLSACSLDRKPLDPNTVTDFNQDAVFSKIYATFALTGQQGPAGSGDVDGIDEGTSSFYRMFWELNEFCTDEGWWIWNDVGLAEIRTQEWTKDNALVMGLYARLYFDITLCNHFLDKTAGATDAKTLQQIAEVRMIRAMNYYYLVDMFNGGPMCLTVSPDNPMPATRSQMYKWLVAECLDLAGEDGDIDAAFEAEFQQAFPIQKTRPYGDNLPEMRATNYRVDRSAAWFLLMRLYLNQTVYNSNDPAVRVEGNYDAAATYAAKVIEQSGHHLLTGDAAAYVKGATTNDDQATYSAYQKLFMGDNNSNGAQDEAIFMIYQDAIQCQSWGGARFVVNAHRDANMMPSGSSDSWSCFRTSPELIYYFFDKNTAGDVKAHEYTMPIEAGDDRATFCSYFVKQSFDSVKNTIVTTETTWSLLGNKQAEFAACWADPKWTAIYSTSKNPYVWESPVGEPAWVDTDIPLFRVAEAYLTYAEAVLRGGQATGTSLTAKGCVDAIRARAHNTKDYTLSLDFLRDEWAREFHSEGLRRSTLVRYGQFAGETANMTWEGHTPGKEAKYNVYPIPTSDETANPNLAGLNAAIGY